MNFHNIKRKVWGFSLIELILAMSLSLVVAAVIGRVYLATQEVMAKYEEIVSVHENGRLAMALMNEAIRDAGFIGCIKFNGQCRLQAFTGSDHGWDKRMVNGSDAIVIEKSSALRDQVFKALQNQDEISVSKNEIYQVGDNVVIADCLHAEKVHIQNVKQLSQPASQLLYAREPLKHAYDQLADVGKYNTTVYFIGETQRLTALKQPIYALYAKNLVGRDLMAKELVEGIEAMRLQYGIISDGSVRYLSAEKVEDWAKVVSVHIDLIVGDCKMHWQSVVQVRIP